MVGINTVPLSWSAGNMRFRGEPKYRIDTTDVFQLKAHTMVVIKARPASGKYCARKEMAACISRHAIQPLKDRYGFHLSNKAVTLTVAVRKER